MPETAENVAGDFKVSRADQDAFALRSQQRWAAAHAAGFFAQRDRRRSRCRRRRAIRRCSTPTSIRGRRPRSSMLAKLKGVVQARTARHGRQRLGRQRRRLRAAARVARRRRTSTG